MFTATSRRTRPVHAASFHGNGSHKTDIQITFTCRPTSNLSFSQINKHSQSVCQLTKATSAGCYTNTDKPKRLAFQIRMKASKRHVRDHDFLTERKFTI